MNNTFRMFARTIVLVLVLVAVGLVVFKNYSYIFSKRVVGEIIEVERVTQANAILTGRAIDPAQMYSFAVAIRDSSGAIFTASSEDRQWAVAKKGFCADARFYPYPPWDLEASGTYFNARLLQLKECPPGTAAPVEPLGAQPNGSANVQPATPSAGAPVSPGVTPTY